MIGNFKTCLILRFKLSGIDASTNIIIVEKCDIIIDMYHNSFQSIITPGFNWQQWVVMRFKRSPALGRPTMSGVDSGFITAELVNL